MHEKAVNSWSKIKIHSDGSVEVDPREIMQQYREQFNKSKQANPEQIKTFGRFRDRPAR